MKYVCAYCNEELRPEKTGKEGVSHGICPSCYNHIKASLGVDLKEYLNMLDHPVFLVDDDVKVLSANYKARHLNGDKIHSIIDKRLGKSSNAMQSDLKGVGDQSVAPDVQYEDRSQQHTRPVIRL